MSTHRSLTGENLHGSKIIIGYVNPNNNIVSTVAGDTYLDVNSKTLWAAAEAGTTTWFKPTGSISAISNVDSIEFTPDLSANPDWVEGGLFYDNVNKTHAGYDDNPDVTTQYGQELHTRTANETGTTIVNGALVAFDKNPLSAIDGVVDGKLAIADLINSDTFIGMATHDILTGTIGKVTTNGIVGGVNTSAYSKGAVLYLSHIESGAVTNVPPPSPYPTIEVGHVVISHATQGKVLITIDDKPLTFVDEKLVYVASNGIDTSAIDGSRDKPYATIGFALSQITDASMSNRYVIHVTPGTYLENNPIQMKSYVNVVGVTPNSSIVTALNNDVLFSMEDSVLIKGLGVIGHVSATTIDISTSGFMAIQDIGIFGGNIGIQVSATSADVTISNLIGVGAGDTFVSVQHGKAIIRDLHLSSIANYDYGIKVNNSDANCFGYGYIDESGNTLESICVRDFGVIDIRDGRIFGRSTSGDGTKALCFHDAIASISNMVLSNCEYGIYIPSATTFTFASLGDMTFRNCTNDVAIFSPNTRLGWSGVADTDKVFINANATVVAAFIDQKPGDEGYSVLGEFHVGSPTRGSESCMGEGDSYSTGMIVYTYDGTTSAINDVSVSARSYEDSQFGFSNTTVDSAIYEASTIEDKSEEPLIHLGIKHFCLSGHDGTGGIISEYYTSAGWVEIQTMSTEGDSPYIPDGDTLFQSLGSHQVRYNNNVVNDGWKKNDPVGYGTDLYWVRHRVTSALDVAPQFEQFKLHSSRTEINDDGWMEYFGRARPIGRLPWSWAGMQQAATILGNQDIYLSDTLDVGRVENLFNSNGDRVGFIGDLPLDCDTSTPISFTWSARSTSTGSSTWTIRWGHSTNGDTIYTDTGGAPTSASTQYVTTLTQNMIANQQTNFSVPIDVSHMVSRRLNGFSDTLWLTLECTTRPGGTDVAGMDVSGYYTKWCEGGHI